jgi:hypothetical protein
MMIVPREWPTKLTLLGFNRDFSMWQRISPTSRSVIVSKSEKVSPWKERPGLFDSGEDQRPWVFASPLGKRRAFCSGEGAFTATIFYDDVVQLLS